jgi:formylglycine-generating enzyme required for sulfatase activity
MEWCHDWFGNLEAENQNDPIGQSHGTYRIFRGGAWNINPGSINPGGCLAAYRNGATPGSRFYNRGLRVCFRLDG